jgi:hypothetical protein
MSPLLLLPQVEPNLLDRLRELLLGAQHELADLLVVLGVFVVGWLLAAVLARLALIVLRAARFNDAVRGAFPGWVREEQHEPARIASWVLYWVVIVATAVLALDTLGWGIGMAVSDRVRDVLPRIVATVLLLLFGVLIAMGLGAVTRRFFAGAGIRGARLRGQIVTAVFTFFAVVLGLEQLGLAAQFVMALGIAVFAAIALALGLAFGLGCRDLARDFVVEYLRSLDADNPRRPPER